jgi:hypothetical protein
VLLDVVERLQHHPQHGCRQLARQGRHLTARRERRGQAGPPPKACYLVGQRLAQRAPVQRRGGQSPDGPPGLGQRAPRERPRLSHQSAGLGAGWHQALSSLQLQRDRGQALGQRVVDLAGQPVALLGHAQLTGAGVDLGMIDRYRCRLCDAHREPKLALGEALAAFPDWQRRQPDQPVPHDQRHLHHRDERDVAEELGREERAPLGVVDHHRVTELGHVCAERLVDREDVAVERPLHRLDVELLLVLVVGMLAFHVAAVRPPRHQRPAALVVQVDGAGRQGQRPRQRPADHRQRLLQVQRGADRPADLEDRLKLAPDELLALVQVERLDDGSDLLGDPAGRLGVLRAVQAGLPMLKLQHAGDPLSQPQRHDHGRPAPRLHSLAQLPRAEPGSPRLVQEIGDQQRLAVHQHVGQAGAVDRLELARSLLLRQRGDLLEATVGAAVLDPADVHQRVGNEPLGRLREALEGNFRVELAADDLASGSQQPIELAFAGAERVRPTGQAGSVGVVIQVAQQADHAPVRRSTRLVTHRSAPREPRAYDVARRANWPRVGRSSAA